MFMQKIVIALLISEFISLISFAQFSNVSFKSSDPSLQNVFEWAKETALRYKGNSEDIVGKWYESALPPRDAFCMRDVSHQCIGAEILGLGPENKNMFTLFVKNISENKDWCSYWEINKYNKPAPEDYRNDNEFWYNLNANFDVMNACWRLYLWTGDTTYINNKLFSNFFEKSANEYIAKWMLSESLLLTRKAHPNVPIPFNIEDPFHRCRGLPSYSEGIQNLKMGVDLVAAIYRGLLTYSYVLTLKGNNVMAEKYASKAKEYQEHIDKYWWDGDASVYNTYYSNDKKFGKDEGEIFLLWFDALKDSARKRKTIEHINSMNLNVENLSYLPLMMYKNNYAEKAYNYILHLSNPSTERREYPEVSFGVIEGMVQGLMGIDADARYNRISTIYRGKPGASCEVDSVPVLGICIDVNHVNNANTVFNNKSIKTIVWRAKFSGSFSAILVNGKVIKAKHEKDEQRNLISFADIIVKPHGSAKAIAQ